MTRDHCRNVIDRDTTPAGWWDVVKDARGTFRADFAMGADRRSLYGFTTFAEASRATWGDSPECDGSGDTCPAPGHGKLRIHVI